MERYCGECVGARPLVLWNIELDTLRSDLGAPCGGLAHRLMLRGGACACAAQGVPAAPREGSAGIHSLPFASEALQRKRKPNA